MSDDILTSYDSLPSFCRLPPSSRVLLNILDDWLSIFAEHSTQQEKESVTAALVSASKEEVSKTEIQSISSLCREHEEAEIRRQLLEMTHCSSPLELLMCNKSKDSSNH